MDRHLDNNSWFSLFPQISGKAPCLEEVLANTAVK